MEKSEDRFLFLNKQFLDAAADPAPPPLNWYCLKGQYIPSYSHFSYNSFRLIGQGY